MRRPCSILLFVIAALDGSACTTKNPLYCDDRVACADPARPYCDVDGNTQASGGIRHTCVPSPDAGPTSSGDAMPNDGQTSAQFSLDVSLGGTGAGVVTTDVGPIHCPGTCSAAFSPGTTVELTAAPDAYSRFDGWAGACSGTGACRVTMTMAQSVAAIFTDTSFMVTVTKQGLGDGTITSTPLGISCGATCTARFPEGMSVMLIATADPSSRFSGWSGPCAGRAPMCTVRADSPQAVGATFDRNIIRGLALGLAHTCVLLDPGVVRCFGSGANGRLGYGDTMNRGDGIGPPANAADVPFGAVVTQIAAGNAHTCAIIEGGMLRCWGEGSNGKLGYGDTSDRYAPSADVPLQGATVVQVGAGASHTCVRTMSNTVRCWGDNTYGQLGYGDTTERHTPGPDVPLFGGAHVTQLAVGGRHTCVLLDTGHIRCWGRAAWGELGYDDTMNRGDTSSDTPVTQDVPIGNVTVSTLVASAADTCALTTTGGVRCWGYAGQGQPGRGNTDNIGDDASDILAIDVPIGFAAMQVAVGPHLCALSSAGEVRCWGYANEGALGYGDTQNRGDGVGPAPSAADVPVSATVSSIAVGFDTTCAILNTGALRCWGGNSSGQLGYGDRTNRGDGVGPPASSGDVPVF